MARIIIAEDEDLFRHILGKTLRKLGHEVHAVTNGTQLLEASARISPDLVITDLCMPEMDGIEAMTALHRKSPDLPIIAMSGGYRQTNGPRLSTAESLGATAILAKPFSLSELSSCIDRSLDPK